MLRLVGAILCIAVYVSAQNNNSSECQIARDKAQKSTAVLKLIPNCESNGDYSAFQCHHESRFCQCWRTDGTPITQPSTKITSCDCIKKRDDLQRKQQQSASGRRLGRARVPRQVVGSYNPQCNDDGTFQKKQCHSSTSMCWCVDSQGQKLATSSPTRVNITCA